MFLKTFNSGIFVISRNMDRKYETRTNILSRPAVAHQMKGLKLKHCDKNLYSLLDCSSTDFTTERIVTICFDFFSGTCNFYKQTLVSVTHSPPPPAQKISFLKKDRPPDKY